MFPARASYKPRIRQLVLTVALTLSACGPGDAALFGDVGDPRVYALDESTGCIRGVPTRMDAGLPEWIRTNFICTTATVNGPFVGFQTLNLPNTGSFYYGPQSPLFEDLPSGQRANRNRIVAQDLHLMIPLAPASFPGPPWPTHGGPIGLTVNGLAVFNNSARAGASLSGEADTFDAYNGHPQEWGVYHHHAEPLNLSRDDAKLVGIALDGFPIYGRRCDNGTQSDTDDFIPDASGTNVLDGMHGHVAATLDFPSGIYHYHAALDETAAMVTLMGSYFYGRPGRAR